MKARKGKKAVCDLNAKFSQEDGYMDFFFSQLSGWVEITD